MLLGFMSESHFLYSKMNLWERDSLPVVLPLFFFEASLWRFLCVGFLEEFLMHEAHCVWKSLETSLVQCLAVGCVVQLVPGEGYLRISFSVTTLFCKGSIMLDGDGSQAWNMYASLVKASHLEILHVCSGWEMKSWIFKQSIANDFM